MEDLMRLFALSFFIIWMLYWSYAWVRTHKEKPQNKEVYSLVSYKFVSRVLTKSMLLILVLQLFGSLVIYPFPDVFAIQLVGVLFVALGVWVSISARKELGSNWSACYDYQVKNKQELVTSGAYKYIRHPIYAGILLMLIGGELVVSSYLLFVALLFTLGAYAQGKKEEKLLESHFGKAYAEYKKKTKMLIPFLL